MGVLAVATSKSETYTFYIIPFRAEIILMESPESVITRPPRVRTTAGWVESTSGTEDCVGLRKDDR